MQHNRETRQPLGNLFQHIETQGRRHQNALFRAGIGCSIGGHIDFVLNAGQSAQLSLNYHAMIVGILDNLAGQLNILSERLGRSVDHNRGKAAVNAALAQLKSIAVIQMQADRRGLP